MSKWIPCHAIRVRKDGGLDVKCSRNPGESQLDAGEYEVTYLKWQPASEDYEFVREHRNFDSFKDAQACAKRLDKKRPQIGSRVSVSRDAGAQMYYASYEHGRRVD